MGIDLQGVRVSRRSLLKATGFAAGAAAIGVGPRFARGAGLQATPAAKLAVSPTASPTGAARGDWATFGYDYAQTRHVPFTQITKDNLKQLGMAWSFDCLKGHPDIPAGLETFPLIVDGVLYATTAYDNVFALDATTGKQIWRWAPKEIGFFKNFGLNVNRGVAVGEGKVFLLTLDNRVISIDAKTGQLIKQINIGDTVPGAKPEFGYYETTAPIYYKGNLFIGSSGGDNGIRGFVMAYKGSDLTPAWANPYWTVPPAGQDWRREGHFHGGGAVWMPVTVDVDTDLLYICAGNPSPDYYGALRPGANPNVDSLIVVKAATGEQVWAQESLSRDLWDYDMAAPPVLMTATVDGKPTKVVAEASKAGQWWCWDATDGTPIYQGVPFSKIDHPNPNPQGVLVYPGVLGGSNYAPQSYDPTSNHYLICNIVAPVEVHQASQQQVERRAQGDVDFGGTFEFPKNYESYGTYVGIDMNDGKVVFNERVPDMLRSGFTTTATGLGFFGGGGPKDPNLHAIDTDSGEMLWSFGVGAPIFAAPSLFTIDGKEYLAVAVGGGSTGNYTPVASRIDVFALGANTTQVKPFPTPAVSIEPIPGPDQWLVLDPKHNNGVIFNAVAAYNDNNNGMNFNGYGNGQMTVTVPLGWIVTINLWNKNPRMPHSLMVTTQQELSKGRNFQAAFVGASTPQPIDGFTGQQVEHLTANGANFKASVPGAYVILCAVPGHAAQGMWDYFKIDPKVKEPTLTTPQGTRKASAPTKAAKAASGM